MCNKPSTQSLITHHNISPYSKMSNSISFIASISIFFFIISSPLIYSQQLYIRRAASSCNTIDTSTSALGYACNGLSRSCLSYLTFRAQPPFNSISAVSNLFSVPPSRLARLNSLPQNATMQTNRMLLVPVSCSCSGQQWRSREGSGRGRLKPPLPNHFIYKNINSNNSLLTKFSASATAGQYYQANTSFEIEHHNTYFLIANDTFQGLSTCQALRAQNSNLNRTLYTATRITVPLRCACPTKNQTDDGVEYLLTYLITWKQSVSIISQLFNVDTATTLAANKLSEQDFTIYPFTTLLVPLKNPPSSTQVSSAPPPPPPPPPPLSSPPPSEGGSGKPWIYAAVGVLGGFALATAIAATVFYLFFVVKQRRRRTEHVTTSSVEKHTPVDKSIIRIRIPQSTKAYSIEELEAATENFSPNFLIKGSVYRGIINGDFAAIKKMSGDVSQEIKILDKMNHFNLIRLSGACFNQGFWYLVYEYAANGSLRDWIIHHHSINGGKILNWNQRLRIALDIAQGLNYLHSYTSPPLVHKDLNSSNVVLDQDLRAKITNLGLARSAEGQDGHFALTRHVVGTQGFMAPEYLENGLVSPMLDVYAFGVVMLEIFTGKEASFLCEEVDLQLSEILVPVLEEEDDDGRQEKVKLLMDPVLEGNYPPQFAVLVVELIDKCIKKDLADRLTTDDIVHSLSTISIMFE